MKAKERIVKLGNLEINLDELAEFIVKATREVYTGKEKHFNVDNELKRLQFREGRLCFIDEFKGHYQISGKSTVELEYPSVDLPEGDWRAIWEMNRFGGMLPEFVGNREVTEMTYKFLRKVLSQVTPKSLFRGPKELFNEDDLAYLNKWQGDIKKFEGNERVLILDKDTYSLNYHGGLIVPE